MALMAQESVPEGEAARDQRLQVRGAKQEELTAVLHLDHYLHHDL